MQEIVLAGLNRGKLIEGHARGLSGADLQAYLAAGVRRILADPASWRLLPEPVSDWLELQRRASALPTPGGLLVETFPFEKRHYLVLYPFEGRPAHQTLGMLLTRRLERAGLRPLGFVATDYALGVWCARDAGEAFLLGEPSLSSLLEPDMLGDDLEAWMAESSLIKRSFRASAEISGLVEKNAIGSKKNGRQMTVSTDLIYDVLRRHQPDHILLRAAWADAATNLLDVGRLSEMLTRIAGRIVHKPLDRISPLAVPVMLEVGRERVAGEADEDVLRQAADAALSAAMGR